MVDLAGKSVFLTGGARGVGRALTKALLEKGAKVFFVDVLEEVGKATEKELREKFGDSVTFRLCDVSDAKQLADAFEAAVSLFGSIDVYVNNAAIAGETKWEKMLAINQEATIRGSFMAYEHMRKDKGGRGGVVINVASMSGFLYNSFSNPVYTATKHAIVAFTTSMGSNPENGNRGMRWGCLCTNAVDTEISPPPEQYTDYHIRQEMYRARGVVVEKLTPSEVAEAFLVQLQDESKTNNGTVVKVGMEDGKPYHQTITMDTINYYPDQKINMTHGDVVFFEPRK